ncbi:hypothetical protein EDB89DRAFT_1194704 [Lactarius sanguifluus]|nr:hypothetical protein EDB89DRAFT_1194704 [Lactarius sanguifluus]
MITWSYDRSAETKSIAAQLISLTASSHLPFPSFVLMSFGQPIQSDEKVALAPTVQPPSYQITTEPPGDAESGRPVHRRRRFRRFCHFFFAALFIWVSARHVIRHCEMRRFGPPHPHFGDIHEDSDFGLAIPPPRTRPGESIDSCVESADWTEVDPRESHYPHGFSVWQQAELSLPTDAVDIFLLSRGLHAFGHLEIIEAADREDIGVEVVVGYHDDSDLFERSSVCTLRRGDNGHGIGIFTPRFDHPPRHHERERDLIFFNITLSLPEGKEVTTVPHFETRLPLFSQIVAGLPTHTFGSISLHSTNRPIFAHISIHSRNGPIEGTFNTSSSLDIDTSNTPVRVVVNALNQNSSAPTNVKIRTSNSVLSADLSLISTFENSTSGAFTVVTRTSNSPLEVNFSDHAPDGLLKLDAHTSNSPVEVRLHPSFEGTFKLRTSVFSATVSPDLEVVDPAGRDRKRSVNVSTIGRFSRIVHGDVAWKPEDEALKPDSKVEVSTSNSPLHVWL